MVKLLLFALAIGFADGQQRDAPQPAQAEMCKVEQRAPFVPGADMPEYVANRENALGPANYAEACHQYDRAYQLYLQVMDSYPQDGRVLMITAQAAVQAERLQDSVPLFRRLLAMGGRCSWSDRVSLMKVYLTLGRWPEFEDLRIDTRKASLAGDQCLPVKDGYLIDTLDLTDEYVRVMEFPVLSEKNFTREHFLFYEEKDRCTGFTPYVELSQVNGAGRTFVLTMHASASSTAVLKSYENGEPDYKTLRADFLALVAKSHHRPVERACAGGVSTTP